MPNPWYNKLVDMLNPPVSRVACATPYGISMSTLFQPQVRFSRMNQSVPSGLNRQLIVDSPCIGKASGGGDKRLPLCAEMMDIPACVRARTLPVSPPPWPLQQGQRQVPQRLAPLRLAQLAGPAGPLSPLKPEPSSRSVKVSKVARGSESKLMIGRLVPQRSK